ncbi:MAG: hypothetical protein Q9226_002996 [Calogaya cf. arnoldii]
MAARLVKVAVRLTIKSLFSTSFLLLYFLFVPSSPSPTPTLVHKPWRSESSDPEVGESNDGESSIDDTEDNGSSKCPVPLSQQFTGQFDDGHGCKKIAEAFNTCGASPLFFCRDTSAQKHCLCDQTKVFNDALMTRCHDFVETQNPTAAQRLKPYVEDGGICGF